ARGATAAPAHEGLPRGCDGDGGAPPAELHGAVAAVATRAPAGIDVEALGAWFAGNVPRFRPPFTAEQITGGRSNITVKLTDADGNDCIIRRPPLHSVLATAHDVGREYRVIHALGPTDVPVPEAFGNCVDDSVIGAPFYAMEYVDGIVLNDVGTAIELLDERARRHASD